ncbi:hypothetical protein [Peribacillus frigoritolerans]|uniref:hypothetical protein n=1 Tax=Peribacillus frigoritolerans TaxID=450367 RepID=UPI002416B62C|nr:hypothetical protein [Peribacillus frigoritolerans]
MKPGSFILLEGFRFFKVNNIGTKSSIDIGEHKYIPFMQPRLGVNYYEQSGTLTIVSEVFLLLSFIIIILSTKNPKRNVLWVILFIIGAAPLLYLAIDHVKNDYMDANIGLGLAFMYTWLYSAVAFIIGIILLVKKKRNNNMSKEL